MPGRIDMRIITVTADDNEIVCSDCGNLMLRRVVSTQPLIFQCNHTTMDEYVEEDRPFIVCPNNAAVFQLTLPDTTWKRIPWYEGAK
jgi:hypothetical protein